MMRLKYISIMAGWSPVRPPLISKSTQIGPSYTIVEV